LKRGTAKERIMQNINSESSYHQSIKFWRFIVFSTLLLSILRGIRVPNIWAYSHFLFDYGQGVVKRGLIGTVINQLNVSYLASYDFFLILSVLFFSVNIFLISLLVRDFIKSQEPVFIWSSVLFTSSLAVVFLSHSIGYFDHIGLLLALVTLKLVGFYRKIIFLFIFMPFALLTHEAAFILFFPVIFMSLLFTLETEENTMHKLILLGLFSATAIILAFYIGNQTLTELETQQMYERVQTSVEHPLRQDAFSVLHRDTGDNLAIMQHQWSLPIRFIHLFLSLLVTAPLFAVFIYLTVLILKKTNTKVHLTALSILASLTPLMLHFFAWDMQRWNTLTITTSFLILYVVYSSILKKQRLSTPSYLYFIFIFLLFMNGVSSVSLFDGYYVKQFPFTEHLKYFFDFFYGKEVLPYIPNQ
jgi:hypothetical protein